MLMRAKEFPIPFNPPRLSCGDITFFRTKEELPYRYVVGCISSFVTVVAGELIHTVDFTIIDPTHICEDTPDGRMRILRVRDTTPEYPGAAPQYEIFLLQLDVVEKASPSVEALLNSGKLPLEDDVLKKLTQTRVTRGKQKARNTNYVDGKEPQEEQIHFWEFAEQTEEAGLHYFVEKCPDNYLRGWIAIPILEADIVGLHVS